jgi:hypothetical protein
MGRLVEVVMVVVATTVLVLVSCMGWALKDEEKAKNG